MNQRLTVSHHDGEGAGVTGGAVGQVAGKQLAGGGNAGGQLGAGGGGLVEFLRQCYTTLVPHWIDTPQENTIMRRGEQRRDNRQEFSRRGETTRYKMREKLASFGDDFWIENEQGERAYKVNGKMMRVRDTLSIEDMQGKEVAALKGKAVDIRQQVKLSMPEGEALVRKDLVNIVRDHLVLETPDGKSLDIKGNFLDHEYEFYEGHNKVAEVSKKWFRIADTYGVQIEPGYNDPLILAATVAVDQLSHDVV